MQEQLTDVICDTSFLIHYSNARIHNLDTLDTDIGEISFVVPDVVLGELRRLSESDANIVGVLESASKYSSVELGQDKYADAAIVRYIRKNGGMVATMDRQLKRAVKDAGGSVISISADRIVLEA